MVRVMNSCSLLGQVGYVRTYKFFVEVNVGYFCSVVPSFSDKKDSEKEGFEMIFLTRRAYHPPRSFHVSVL